MKKIIVGIVIVAMFGYAIYDFVLTSGSETGGEDFNEEDYEVGLEEGNLAPDFELETLEGETVQLSDYRGKPVFLNFWASWCGPCRSEMPDMEKLHNEKEVNVLAVNLTETENNQENVSEFVEEFELTFPILMDVDTVVANEYEIQPVPTTFMIDSNGLVHSKSLGALNYEQMVQNLEDMK